MKKTKILVATTNNGKFEEIRYAFSMLPFEIIGLKDLKEKIEAPEETGQTLEENAFIKAKFYAEKTKMITLADDTGLFIDGLQGWPGVQSARIGESDEDRRQKVLNSLLEMENREAEFKIAMASYDPTDDTYFMCVSSDKGKILKEKTKKGVKGFGYDPIFFSYEAGKTFAELSMNEKNSYSHRGKALKKMEHFLADKYNAKNFVVPIALIVKNNKILLNLRNDPHTLEFHKKWEFPGGSVELGEQMRDNLIKEMWEEAGYKIEPIKLLQEIFVEVGTQKNGVKYQVFLVPYVCKIIGGEGKYDDLETLDSQFFDFEEVRDLELLANNKEIFYKLLPELKETIKQYQL